MSDDLDQLIRRSMKSLDGDTPSGYFDTLPDRTLARLEASMQSGTSTHTEQDPSTGVPPARDEDSGLHDIRSLAQSTKMRISKRVSTQPPNMSDSEMVAQTSGAWNAVALPEPARMVSLPEIDELPSAKDVRAHDKAARAGLSHPAHAAHPGHPAHSAARTSRKLLAVMGLSLAAAAGATIFVMTRESAEKATAPGVVTATPAPPAAPAAAPAPAPPPAQIAAPDPSAPAGGEAKPTDEAAPPPDTGTGTAAVVAPKAPAHKGAGSAGPAKQVKKLDSKDKADEKAKAPAPETKKTGTKEDGSSDPSFDALLKEAGVDQTKKVEKPKLDKKELSGDDFKKGMSAVGKKAQGCYKGNQGTVSFKVTIAPSGSVSKVAVSGAFAGTPEGDCVQKAVQGASFPPWDGGPQSFTFSYLLSE